LLLCGGGGGGGGVYFSPLKKIGNLPFKACNLSFQRFSLVNIFFINFAFVILTLLKVLKNVEL